jgi:rSAM/selenodomain-associated transferase 2
MLSIVIPVLREARHLEQLLPELAARCPGAEVIVVDGGSEDDTATVVERFPAVRLLTTARGRARQMNAGARAAGGDILLFLHADTRVPPGAEAAITGALADPRVVGGRFDVAFDNPAPTFRAIAAFMNARSRLTGISTGDQAIFVRHTVFERLGGYPDIPLMEDVALSRRLKRAGRLAPLRLRVTTAARKWEREGVARTVLLMWSLRFLYFCGLSPRRLHRWYYRGPAALLLALALAGPGLAQAPIELPFARPAEPSGPPPGWEPLTFRKIPRHTVYEVVAEGERRVLRAESHAAASGLIRPLDLDPAVYRILSWRWKVENVLQTADARRKDGDDYAARVYVAFRFEPESASLWERARYGTYRALFGRYPPAAALNYVWDNRLPPDTTLDNAYTDRAKMIVLRSGPELVGRWVEERRDIYADYRRLFGAAPPRIAGVAVMTDTDDTGERAVAWYDTLTLHPAE